MSTVQTQSTIVHLESGLAAASVNQRASAESSFTSGALTVTAVDEVVLIGDIHTPRQVFLKLVSGDDLLIGFEEDVYPMRLAGAADHALIPLNVPGRCEISDLETAADSGGSLNDKYFTLSDRNGEVKVVITNDGTTSLTSTGRLKIITIANDDLAADIASAIVAAFDLDPELLVTSLEDIIVRFTDRHTGVRTAISEGDTTFTVTTTQSGDVPQPIHLKSIGTSQVVVAVAPN